MDSSQADLENDESDEEEDNDWTPDPADRGLF